MGLDGGRIAVESRTVLTSDLDFHLPSELIAQTPAARREASRLLHYQRATRSIGHQQFSDLPALLRPGDLLVFNNARVVPARFVLRKNTGGRVEGLYLGVASPGVWNVLLKNFGPPRADVGLHFAQSPQIQAKVVCQEAGGAYRLSVGIDEPATEFLERIGRMPLPPYIKRGAESDDRDELDRERYQTVYASAPGSVAAPTAGLHFTPALLSRLKEMGLQTCFVTLHVGLGTFKPVSADKLQDHTMHVESYSIDADAADAINRAKREKRRVIAVGTTAARVLESQAAGDIEPKFGQTGIFIYPPYQWKHVEALITNFHLPKSTLIALVAALVGLDEQRRIYREAIEQRYRFFSYGDAMLVE